MNEIPQIERVRYELKRRRLTVVRVEPLVPNMLRVVLEGDDLAGFTSLGFDDHIKLFFPDGDNEPAKRDFTPRRFDADSGELWIDFFLHDAGPAAAWAAQAKPGQILNAGGPKGSSVISLAGIALHLLVGDETALPAIGRRLEELPAGARALVVVELDAGVAPPALHSRASLQVEFVTRASAGAASAEQIIAGLRELEFHSERCFAWIAVESQAARAIRQYLREERGFDKKWIKASGYWQRGNEGSHDSIRDED